MTRARSGPLTAPLRRRLSIPRWVSSCPHVAVERRESEQVRVPFRGAFHAREMGSTQTVCGQAALSWVNVHERPFRLGDDLNCPDCDRLLAGGRVDPMEAREVARGERRRPGC
jgi:hypothetical protein